MKAPRPCSLLLIFRRGMSLHAVHKMRQCNLICARRASAVESGSRRVGSAAGSKPRCWRCLRAAWCMCLLFCQRANVVVGVAWEAAAKWRADSSGRLVKKGRFAKCFCSKVLLGRKFHVFLPALQQATPVFAQQAHQECKLRLSVQPRDPRARSPSLAHCTSGTYVATQSALRTITSFT
jgi:hypothetical protein